MNSHDIVLLAVAVIGSTGLIGAPAMYFKLKPETGQILVDTAKDVVIIQKGVVEDLREELKEVKLTLKNLKAELKQTVAECATELEELRARIRGLEGKA